MDKVGQNFQKTHKFYMDSGIFINTPPTMGLALNRSYKHMNNSKPIYFKTSRFF